MPTSPPTRGWPSTRPSPRWPAPRPPTTLARSPRVGPMRWWTSSRRTSMPASGRTGGRCPPGRAGVRTCRSPPPRRRCSASTTSPASWLGTGRSPRRWPAPPELAGPLVDQYRPPRGAGGDRAGHRRGDRPVPSQLAGLVVEAEQRRRGGGDLQVRTPALPGGQRPPVRPDAGIEVRRDEVHQRIGPTRGDRARVVGGRGAGQRGEGRVDGYPLVGGEVGIQPGHPVPGGLQVDEAVGQRRAVSLLGGSGVLRELHPTDPSY